MLRQSQRIGSSLALGLLILGSTIAAGQEIPIETVPPAPSAEKAIAVPPEPAPKCFNRISGIAIVNGERAHLGTLYDVMVNNRGELRYAIVSYGGVVRIGASYVAVPWHAVSGLANDKNWTIDISTELFAKAPIIKSSDYSELLDPEFVANLHEYFAPDSKAGTANDAQAVAEAVFPANDLMGSMLAQPNGKNLAHLTDLVLLTAAPAQPRESEEKSTAAFPQEGVEPTKQANADKENADTLAKIDREPTSDQESDAISEPAKPAANPRSDRVEYLIVSYGGLFGVGERLIVVPWDAVHLVVGDGPSRFEINMDEQQLAMAPTLKTADFAELSDEAFVETVGEYFDSLDEHEEIDALDEREEVESLPEIERIDK